MIQSSEIVTDPLDVKGDVSYYYSSPLIKIRKLLNGISLQKENAMSLLQLLHRDSSFDELSAGCERLRAKIVDRNELLKELLKEHFSKFVSAKSSIQRTLFIFIY